jgi:UDP-GlcNAc:undecaprenyl-phosphate GlcNAc-1-phosphate transferase
VYSFNEIIISALVAAFVCSVIVPVLSNQAKPLGLLDKPGGRKQHTGYTPIVGGLAVYLAVLISGVVLGFNSAFFLPLLISLPIVVSGLIDDRQALTPAVRIPIQMLCALGMIYFGGVEIRNIGDITGNGQVLLVGFGALFFTVMCTVGVINSINMVDGVDGLSGFLIALSLSPMALFAWISQDMAAVALLLSLITAIIAFLIYNSRLFRAHARVFLGDAGSTFLGFVLVWYLIKYTQGDSAVLSPVSAGWILGLPLADTVAVMMRRVLDKGSPLVADRKHFHYRLLDAGLGVNKTVLVMLGIHSIFIAVGMASNAYGGAEPVFFWAFVLVTALHLLFTPRVLAVLFARGIFGEKVIEMQSVRVVK